MAYAGVASICYPLTCTTTFPAFLHAYFAMNLLNLPTELLTTICGHVDWDDVLRVRRVAYLYALPVGREALTLLACRPVEGSRKYPILARHGPPYSRDTSSPEGSHNPSAFPSRYPAAPLANWRSLSLHGRRRGQRSSQQPSPRPP
ncbi:hypothetical protein FA13DRAFT_827921 [Coprinellus micaceus]|uniref:F-box domain-containing protein n=1 Tax=Coprinellus micaceus TaxID=71717 RepID=A0A4Y7T1M8_COPMI|nr:hypothetical protein FA13DRAFT_827921 [Coprinellus micaceus]